MKTYTADDFKKWGAQGPKLRKTNRTLTTAQAKAMVAAREKKRRKIKRVTRRANDRAMPPEERRQSASPCPKTYKNTLWRDPKGRLTTPGNMTAVTATTDEGVVWDVSCEPFRVKYVAGKIRLRKMPNVQDHL